MTDLWLPDVRVAKISPKLMDKTGRFTSPLSSNVRTIARPGDRWGFTLEYANLQGQDRGRLEALIAAQRGGANRVLYSPGDYLQRGSFANGELLPNPAFVNGVTGWNTGASTSLSASDRLLRVTKLGVSSGADMLVNVSGIACSQFAPYVVRAMLLAGAGVYSGGFTLRLGSSNAAADYGESPVGSYGMRVFAAVAQGTAIYMDVVDYTTNGALAGNFLSVPFASISRCLLCDNGTNLLLQSDPIGVTSPWTLSNATAGANGSPCPDGSLNAYYMAEAGTTTQHSAVQVLTVSSGAAADYTLSVFANCSACTRQWVCLQLLESTGGTAALAYFNVSTGAIGTTAVGTNWSNIRMTAVPYGSGWYRFSITARKTNAATTLSATVGLASANGTNSYAGAGGTAMLTWRATLAQSSVVMRPVQTLTTATPTGILQTGSGIYVKGAPASAAGLLLSGDWIELNNELKRVTAPLNSDAAGLGYLQFSPPLRNPPADNDPVILNMPMGRFIFSASENGWSSVPPYFASSTLELVEAL